MPYLCIVVSYTHTNIEVKIKTHNIMNENQKPFLSQLRGLEVGESITQPISKRSYIAVAATRFGVEWDKRFRVSSSREDKTVTITRIL